MMKIKNVLLCLLICSPFLIAQIENVSSDNEVYTFLKRMQVEGILLNYSDVVLPLSRKEVVQDLIAIDSLKEKLNSIDKEFLRKLKAKFSLDENNDYKKPASLLNDFPNNLKEYVFKNTEKHFYYYNDSALTFYSDIFGDYKFIYSGQYKENSSLFNLGARAYGSYDNWLGFYLQGSNGIVKNNRKVALLDPRVRQSFTFNNTKIDFFDGTKGYIRFQKNIVSAELGRERILWGQSYINRMILSNNPQLFDFVRFNISYKSLNYKFLHGWLVQPAEIVYSDSLVGNIKNKGSKYLAISRLGFQPNNRISLGITQFVIYANRPFEAAYLNPFLFWESAQRSLNDLDNSFLSFDVRYLITNGLEFSGNVIFDDIKLDVLTTGEFSKVDNRSAWQAGIMLTDPLFFRNATLKLEYLQIRPYTFSHPGLGESLAYTNNGYLLNSNIQPNSVRFSSQFSYRLTQDFFINLTYEHTIHGNNIYDSNGKIIKNVGGNVFNNYSILFSDTAPLLDGIRETTDLFNLDIQYEFIWGYYLMFRYQYKRSVIENSANLNNNFYIAFRLDFQ